jgi:hypothetical protein
MRRLDRAQRRAPSSRGWVALAGRGRETLLVFFVPVRGISSRLALVR